MPARVLLWAADLVHRGRAVKAALDQRRGVRRSRRARHTPYRPARFNNRQRQAGWLPPSLLSRIQNVVTWVQRLRCFCPLSGLGMELVRFDTQLLDNAEISGVEYQQGALQGYEVREYLLDKWGRHCAYCDTTDVPLEIEHMVPVSRGGSNWVSNLTLACHACNQTKGKQTAREFGYPDLHRQAKASLKDAAAVNATRKTLHAQLLAVGLPVEVGTGGRTMYNRSMQGYPKAHWIDAACVGINGDKVELAPEMSPLRIMAMGRQARQMCRMNRYGFPRTGSKTSRFHHGFQTGDLVRAVQPKSVGLKVFGTVIGRVSARETGSFKVAGTDGIKARYCRRLQGADGYDYAKGVKALSSSA